MKNMYTLFLAFAISLLSVTVYSQNTGPVWQNILNSDYITEMAETSSHYWVATTGGLVKIDKATLQVTNLNKGNSDIPFNQVLCIDIDQQGNIWIGGNYYLAKFDGNAWTTYSTMNGDFDYISIFSITHDSQGIIWFGTSSNGFF